MTASTAPESVFDVEAFIKDYYDAWGGTDLDRIMSYYAEDVVLQTPGALMEGKEAVREQFARPFTTAFPGNRHVVTNMISGRGVVTVEFTFEAKHTGPFAGHAATGARIKLPGCGVYAYDSAKRQITGGRIYFDVGTLLQTITKLPAIDPDVDVEIVREGKNLKGRLLGVFLGIVGKGQLEKCCKEPESHRSPELQGQRRGKGLDEVGAVLQLPSASRMLELLSDELPVFPDHVGPAARPILWYRPIPSSNRFAF